MVLATVGRFKIVVVSFTFIIDGIFHVAQDILLLIFCLFLYNRYKGSS